MATRTALRNSFLGALFFGFLAPPIGSLGLSVPLAIYAFIAKPGSEAIVLALALLIGLAFWSYLVGIVPAAITGLLVGPFRAHFGAWRYCLAVGALGCVIPCLGWYLLIPSGRQPPEALTALNIGATAGVYLALLGLPGLVGGTVSARLFRGGESK